MTLIDRLQFSPEAITGLCRTCAWATARRGFRPAEAEVFCRIVGPNSRVRYAVRECSSYIDRRAQAAAPPPTEGRSEARRYGFVTEIKLEDSSEVKTEPGERSVKPSR
jgi:hypothetical protein